MALDGSHSAGDSGHVTDHNLLDVTLAKKYEKPTSGIPVSDLAADVQASLDAADAAVSTAGDQTVAGVKEFTSPVKVADGAADDDALNKAQVEDLIDVAVPPGTLSVYMASGDDSDLASALAPFADLTGGVVLVKVAGS